MNELQFLVKETTCDVLLCTLHFWMFFCLWLYPSASQEEVCVDVGADPATAMQLVQKMQTTNVQLDQPASSAMPQIKDVPAPTGETPKPGGGKGETDEKPKKAKKEKPLASWHLHC